MGPDMKDFILHIHHQRLKNADKFYTLLFGIPVILIVMFWRAPPAGHITLLNILSACGIALAINMADWLAYFHKDRGQQAYYCLWRLLPIVVGGFIVLQMH